MEQETTYFLDDPQNNKMVVEAIDTTALLTSYQKMVLRNIVKSSINHKCIISLNDIRKSTQSPLTSSTLSGIFITLTRNGYISRFQKSDNGVHYFDINFELIKTIITSYEMHKKLHQE